jgi:hypothetical protein
VNDLDDRILEPLAPAGLFEEINRRADRIGATSLLEREAAARFPPERAGDMTVGDDEVFVDEPTGADVGVWRHAGHVDASNRLCGPAKPVAGILQPLAPHVALAVAELETRHAADDRQHRPPDAQHDVAKGIVAKGMFKRAARQRPRTAQTAKAANLRGQLAIGSVEPGDELFHPRVNIFHDDSGSAADYNERHDPRRSPGSRRRSRFRATGERQDRRHRRSGAHPDR